MPDLTISEDRTLASRLRVNFLVAGVLVCISAAAGTLPFVTLVASGAYSV